MPSRPPLISLCLICCLCFAFCQTARIEPIDRQQAALASAHLSRVLKEGRCQKPSPRVIQFQTLKEKDHHKKYLPSCTVIHVCGPETGCCENEGHVCTAIEKEVVTLYFWVIEITPNGTKRSVESMVVTNDTECACRPPPPINLKKLERDGGTELQSLVTSSHLSMSEGRIIESMRVNSALKIFPPINLLFVILVIVRNKLF